MLHINTETKPPKLAASGDPIDIASDFLYAIGKLYVVLSNADQMAAKIFKESLIAGIAHPDAPTWHLRQHPGEISVVSRIPKERE